MLVELVIAPEAELDIADAYVWYEGRRAGLGEEFLSSVDACLEGIRRRPEMYPVVHEGYRRSLIRRFPYAVFYEQSEATVTIYAVFHTSRDPDKWRRDLMLSIERAHFGPALPVGGPRPAGPPLVEDQVFVGLRGRQRGPVPLVE